MSELNTFHTPDMTVRIWKTGSAEIHGAGSSDGCVELVAFDGRQVQLVFREDGSVMLRGWCGKYERLEDEAQYDMYSRGEMGDETLSFHGELPPVPNPVREARDKRLADLRAERARSLAIHNRKQQELEFHRLANELGYAVENRD